MNHNWVLLSGTNARYSFEREEDGRWIAILECVPGAMAYGETPELAEKALDALVCKIACEGAVAIAAADQAATERACAAVCVLCRHGNIWLPAVEDGESGFWMHRHSNPDHHQGPMICDASAIREAAANAESGDA